MSYKERCIVTRGGIYCKKSSKRKYAIANSKHEKLEFNDIYDGNSSEDEINNILKNINSNKIQELKIDGLSKINSTFMTALAHSKTETLKSLTIINTGITRGDIRLLTFFILHNISLNNLEIDFSNKNDAGECSFCLHWIITTLSNKGSYLKYISFANCSKKNLSSDTRIAGHIMTLLKRNENLIILKLRNIGLTDADIEIISKTLCDNNLEELDISNNIYITDLGGMAIVKELEKNINKSKLREINVSGTRITEKIKQKMQKYVAITEKKLPWVSMKRLLNKEEFYGYKY